MNEKTEWKQKGGNGKLHSSGSNKSPGKKADYTDSGLFKAGLALAAGLIIAALAKGVKDSDYYK